MLIVAEFRCRRMISIWDELCERIVLPDIPSARRQSAINNLERMAILSR